MNPRKESTKRIFQKELRNESTKRIFWNQHGFANPKPRICKDSGLFKVRLCTKDSSGFVRIHWIRENRSNLLKISLQNESTKRIFWKHLGFVIHDTKRIRIRFVRHELNLFGVRICDYETKRIHVFTNLLYDSRILSFLHIFNATVMLVKKAFVVFTHFLCYFYAGKDSLFSFYTFLMLLLHL